MANCLKIIVLFALMALGILLPAGNAFATTPVPSGPSLPGMTIIIKEDGKPVVQRDMALKKFIILSYIKAEGLTKKEVAEAEECRMIGAGTDVPNYTNSGYTSSGGLFEFADSDREKACKVDGVWKLVRCGNLVWFYKKENVYEGKVILVRSFAKVKFTIHLVAKVKATGSCGWAYASAKLHQKVSLKSLVKSKGSVLVRLYMKGYDRAETKVKARISCEVTITVIPPPNCTTCSPPPPYECPSGSVPKEGKCVKDGNTTPQPPPSAPGPNPPPSGGTGDPGSNQCYRESDAQPVPPRSDGTCPAGSYG